jgi:hypothetical protein
MGVSRTYVQKASAMGVCAMSKEAWWGIGVTIVGTGIGVIGAVLDKTTAIAIGIALIVFGLCVILWAQFLKESEIHGWFAFEVVPELHAHEQFRPTIKNCGPRSVRDVRFDKIESRQGLELQFNPLPSLSQGERAELGFRAGEGGKYPGVAGHIVTFFEGGSPETNKLCYILTVHFLDGTKSLREEHAVIGQPLPKGGVGIEIFPRRK